MFKRSVLQLIALISSFTIIIGAVSAAESSISSREDDEFSTYMPVILAPFDILYFDDFSDSNSGWLVDDDGEVRWSYQNEEYEMLIRKERIWSGAIAPVSGFVDYSVEAEMHRQEGTESDLGLIFDFLDWDNYYFFVIDPGDQWYGVAKIDDGQAEIVIPQTNTSKIKANNETNTLKIERDGNNLGVYINGELLNSAVDMSFEGDLSAGFYAESDQDAPAAIRYDNFTVRSLNSTNLNNKSLMQITRERVENSRQGVGDIFRDFIP